MNYYNDDMGRDLTLYPAKANKRSLCDYLRELGFKPTKHLWKWPEGTRSFRWFDEQDYRSIDGVSAVVYPISLEEKRITSNDWALHIRNTYGASWYDVRMLNKVLRDARKRFGGTIKGDYGTNRYAPLWEDDSTPISRGLSIVYEYVTTQLSLVQYALPHASINQSTSETLGTDDLAEYIRSLDPSRVIYNGLVPFAVAMFEYFFSQVFQILIKYDDRALEKRKTHTQKVSFDTVLEVHNHERSIENVIASNYTFQNLTQMNRAYKEWLEIDVRGVLYKKRKIGSTITFLENRVSEIIEYRHGIVHGFDIDPRLSREGYVQILDAIQKSIEEFLCFLENRYQVTVVELGNSAK